MTEDSQHLGETGTSSPSTDGAMERSPSASAPNIPPEIAQIIEKIPPEEARRLVQLSVTSASMMGPMPNPILQHIRGEHIDKFIDIADKADVRTQEDRKDHRRTMAVLSAFILVILGGMWLLLPNDKTESFGEIVKMLLIFLAGGAGGYGLGKGAASDN